MKIDADEMRSALRYLTPQERSRLDALLKSSVQPNLLKNSFSQQTAFIQDPCRLKALLGTRRMAKTYSAGLYLLKTALDRPNTSSVYLGLTRDTAKRIVWNDVLKSIVKKHKIEGVKWNETELTATLPNGSIIYVLGVNDSDSEVDKLLGKKFALAVIDEAASYTIDLHNLVYKILLPALADLGGTCCLIGTPDNLKRGLFYDLTRDVPCQPPTRTDRQGWSIHTWSTWDNPFTCKQWEETINKLRVDDPHVDEQPWFQQHYLGKWTIDDSAKIYRYSAERNGWDGRLPEQRSPYHYTLGIDLGFADATALVVLAYHDYDPCVYILRGEKRVGKTISEVADWIKEWNGYYPFEAMVVDGANKQAVQEMVKHHALPLQAAEKSDKVSFIRIMNSDFISGKIRVDRVGCKDLIDEWDQLVWDKRALEKNLYREGAFHGDLCDAALYGYRFTYAYAHQPNPQGLPHEILARREAEAWARDLEEGKRLREEAFEGSEYLFY